MRRRVAGGESGPGSADAPSAVAIQPDGNLVVVGTASAWIGGTPRRTVVAGRYLGQ